MLPRIIDKRSGVQCFEHPLMANKISVPRGTNDILPAETPLWQEIERKARQILRNYNYREIRTPHFEDVGLFKDNQLEIGYRQATVRALTKHVVGIFDDNEVLIFGVKYDEEDRHKGHFKDNQLVKGVEECKDRTYGSYRMMVYQIEHDGDGTKTKYYKQELDLSHSIKTEHGIFKCGRWGEFLKKGRKDYYKAEYSGWNPGIVTEIGGFDRVGRLKMGRQELDVGQFFLGARTIRFIYGVPFPYYGKTFK